MSLDTIMSVNDEDREQYKEAVKEAIKEWLNSQFAKFGRWSLVSIGAAALSAVLYLILTMHGWRAP